MTKTYICIPAVEQQQRGSRLHAFMHLSQQFDEKMSSYFFLDSVLLVKIVFSLPSKLIFLPPSYFNFVFLRNFIFFATAVLFFSDGPNGPP